MSFNMSALRGTEKGNQPPLERQINVPPGGWKEHTLYLVLVSYRTSNPIHESYLKVGFLDEETGQPAGYSLFWDNTSGPSEFSSAHYVQVLCELHTEGT